MAFYHIETIKLTANANTITFSDIPQDYLDLYVVGSFKIGSPGFYLQRNGSDMASQKGMTLVDNQNKNIDSSYMGIPPSSTESSNFYVCELNLPDYTGSINRTAGITWSYSDATTSITNSAFGFGTAKAGTSPITSLGFRGNGTNFLTGTTFSLYLTGA